MFQPPEIVIERGYLQVVLSEDPLDDRERSLVEPLGFIEIGQVFANDTKVVTDEGHFDGIVPMDFFLQRQRHSE
jgi:hypothetical protein